MLANYIDPIISFSVGAYFTAVAYGYLPTPAKDPVKGQEWLNRFGKMFKICGPFVMVVSLGLALETYFRLNP